MSAEVHRLGCSGDAADAQARKGPGAEHRGSSQLIPPVRELWKLLRSRQPKEVTWSEQWEVARSGKGWMESWGVVVVLSGSDGGRATGEGGGRHSRGCAAEPAGCFGCPPG